MNWCGAFVQWGYYLLDSRSQKLDASGYRPSPFLAHLMVKIVLNQILLASNYLFLSHQFIDTSTFLAFLHLILLSILPTNTIVYQCGQVTVFCVQHFGVNWLHFLLVEKYNTVGKTSRKQLQGSKSHYRLSLVWLILYDLQGCVGTKLRPEISESPLHRK